MRPISRLPHAPDFLLGMIDVRGSGYPIVDLRTKLDLPAVPADRRHPHHHSRRADEGPHASASASSPTASSK